MTTPSPTLPPPVVPPLGPRHDLVPGPGGGRTAWIVAASIFTAAVLGWGTFSLIDLLAHGERDVTITYDSTIAAVDIANETGDVAIVARPDVDTVTVTTRISDGLRATGVSDRMAGDTLVLRGTCPNIGGTWCSVTYSVEVPDGTVVRIRTSDGDVRIAGPLGDLDVASDDGSIVADGLGSDVVVARSDDGRVFVRFTDEPSSVVATSDHGRVEVVVPDEPGAFSVDAFSGDRSTDVQIRTDPASPRTIRAVSGHGSVVVRYGD